MDISAAYPPAEGWRRRADIESTSCGCWRIIRLPTTHLFAHFRTGRCQEVAEELLYQYARRLAEKEETDHSAVFIDSTKLESKMGGYTFVWKETILKHRDKVKAELKKLTSMETTPEVVGCYPDGNSALILVCARLAMLPERSGDARNI